MNRTAPLGTPVPNGWSVHPLGRLVDRSRQAGRPDAPALSVYLEDGVVLRDSRDDNFNRLGSDLSKYLVVRPGDLVFNKLRTWQGGLGASNYEGIVSPAYFVCRPKEGVNAWFLHYLLRSRLYLDELTRLSKWMPPSQFDIAWDDLRSVNIILPPPRIQQTIVEYLDAETRRISRLIKAQRKLVDLLNERIDAVIRHHVADSPLAGGAKLAALPVKRLLARVERPYVEASTVITAYRDGEVTARTSRREEGYTLAQSETGFQGVQVGDVVIHGLDGFSGAIGTSRADGCCSPVYHVCVVRDGYDNRYVARLLRVLALDGYLGAHATSVRERAVDLRNWELLGAIRVPAPKLHDQVAVAALVEQVPPMTDVTNRIVALLRERHEAITTAVCTGEVAAE